jgi:23S rRNA pseudouridine955/2504/2580 synthase
MATPLAQSQPSARILLVDDESDGQRLDNFLMRHLKGVPKTHIYRIIRSGEVRINKGRVQADSRVQAGDSVRLPPVRVAEKSVDAPLAPAREFPVLWEDDDLMAIDKPAGVAVHGGSGVSFGVIEQLRQSRPQAPLLELVHRLDRETSGILLVAKKKSALRQLQDQFRERETGKTYLALVKGVWPRNKKVIDCPLVKYLLPNGERRVQVAAVADPHAMRSISLVRMLQVVQPPGSWPIEAAAHFSLLAVTIKTGRTHQIRVHLSSQGYPIVGDDKYGDFELNKLAARFGLKRMFLHAWQLRFTHPRLGETIQLNTQLPNDLLWGGLIQTPDLKL